MNIKPVSEILTTAGLVEPMLAALVPNENNYKVLLIQPQGVIETNDSVRNQDHDLARKQFGRFLVDAQETDADLVVTPEYSMPWGILIDTIKAGIIPRQGKIWALGCESITYAELENIRQDIAPRTTVLHESLQVNQERFVSPLAYVFVAPTVNDNHVLKTVVLVQFKTHPMGDPDHFEVNRLQRGSTIYQFGGTDQSLKLVSLICSDTFAFNDVNAKAIYDRALILHIQLNSNPRHEQFLWCRQQLLKYQGDATEVLCLNWAAGIQQYCNGQNKCWNNISGSAWYLKPREFDNRDATLCANHRRGLYYTWLQSLRTHALFFNFASATYLITSTKVTHIGVPGAGPGRRGPQLEKMCCWNDATGTWIEREVAEDGFSHVVSDSGHAKEELINIASRSPLEVERVLALSAGNIENREDWHNTQFLDSCIIESSEVIKRITFAQDTHPQAQQFRTARLKRCGRLWDILKDDNRLPPALADLKDGFSFEWSPPFSHQNVISTKGKRATVIYMGEDVTDSQIEAVAKRVAEFLNRGFSGPNESLDARQRLAIWFRDNNGEISLYDHSRFVRYDSPNDISEFDIGRQI